MAIPWLRCLFTRWTVSFDTSAGFMKNLKYILCIWWCILAVDWSLLMLRIGERKLGKFAEVSWGRWSNRRKREQCQLSGPCQPAALYESQSTDLHKWLFIASSRLWHTHKEFVNSKSVPAIETDQWAYRMRYVCIEGRHWIQDMGSARSDLAMIKMMW